MNLLESITRFYASSVGKKILVALSGLVLLLFLAGHLAGNLLIYLGRTALNDYAEFLHHALHGTGSGSLERDSWPPSSFTSRRPSNSPGKTAPPGKPAATSSRPRFRRPMPPGP